MVLESPLTLNPVSLAKLQKRPRNASNEAPSQSLDLAGKCTGSRTALVNAKCSKLLKDPYFSIFIEG